MKKILLMLAVAAMSAQSAVAQAVEESKTLDNWYVGVNTGLNVPAKTVKFGETNSQFGLRVGRYLTPVFGFGLEAQGYFGKKGHFEKSHTAINALTYMLYGTLNFNNWFWGYPGTPRDFEVVGLAGFGGGRFCGADASWNKMVNNEPVKLALDFTYNFGKAKEWQLYAEPALIYELANGQTDVEFNINRAFFALNIGVNYKFLNSNGTHNFKLVEPCDRSEIDALNDQINAMRQANNDFEGELNLKDAKIADLEKALKECNDRPAPVLEQKSVYITNLQPTVLFRQGKSVIDPAQYAPIELIAIYMRNHPEAIVEVKGYASPEGNLELNQRLSIERANVVRNALINRYKIAPNRLTATGCGPTDKLFEQVEFNRVATFNDNSKQ